MGLWNSASAETIHVTPPSGTDVADGSGTADDPFHSLTTALQNANPGTIVCVHAGRYIECVDVDDVWGTSSQNIVVKPYGNDEVTIDALLPEFLDPQGRWQSVDDGVSDEYVWSEQFLPAAGASSESNTVTHGAFTHNAPYTRLITYSQVGDLRAAAQIFPKDGTEGNRVWTRTKANGVVTYEITPDPGEYRPWVYMGPGIWFGKGDNGDGDRRVHIRLSHTTNNIPGWPDYTGLTDPNLLELALSANGSHALFLTNCGHLAFEHLTFRFGDEDTIRLNRCTDITFDHVQVKAASRAVRVQNNNGVSSYIQIRHCDIDGGTPTWFFRSDRKDEYYFGPDDQHVILNRLGASTTGALLSSGKGSSHVTVEYCRIANGHDVVVFGDFARFHHNWVNNINDDALSMGGEEAGTDHARIYQNVMTRSLTGLSFHADPVGDIKFYRNLVDLREPTLGIRPRAENDASISLRQGHFYKDGVTHGTFDLWHNTCLVLDPGAEGSAFDQKIAQAGYGVYQTIEQLLNEVLVVSTARRSYNNIFVAVFSRSNFTRPIAFLPPSWFVGRSDGNGYHRVGPADELLDKHDNLLTKRFAVVKTSHNPRGEFDTLDGYHAAHLPNEEHGEMGPPIFRSFSWFDGRPTLYDDFRLHPGGPLTLGATLPLDMLYIDLQATGFLSLFSHRIRGCYPRLPSWLSWLGSDRLHVGVDGAEHFPRL